MGDFNHFRRGMRTCRYNDKVTNNNLGIKYFLCIYGMVTKRQTHRKKTQKVYNIEDINTKNNGRKDKNSENPNKKMKYIEKHKNK